MNQYAQNNRLNEIQKSELFVAMGDLSGETYLSLYYTRDLMKRYRISDDPVLLPSSITSRLYPRPHQDLVLENSKNFSVEDNIIYAVMRQESFFRESAISSANARGLMQVMPSTGKILAKSLKVNKYSLHDPEISIAFGAKFLADLLKSNQNEIRWATIAYNGGPGNLRKWKRLHYKGDFNHFLENLPSRESRNYCRIVVSNYINYKALQIINGYAQ
jgi:soluble lytic murein transglycosylase-like protein